MTPEEISRFFGRDDALVRQLIIRPYLASNGATASLLR